MDSITLSNMIFFAYHGVLPEEQRIGQRFQADVKLYLDLAPAGQTDDLRLTVNYAQAYEVVKRIMDNRKFQLIEALAEAVARELLGSFLQVQQVDVTIRKPAAPVAGILDYAEVAISRKRSL